MYRIVKTKYNISRTEKMLNDLERQGLKAICSIERGKFIVLHKEEPSAWVKEEPPKEEPKVKPVKEEPKIETPVIETPKEEPIIEVKKEPPKEKLNITIPLEV